MSNRKHDEQRGMTLNQKRKINKMKKKAHKNGKLKIKLQMIELKINGLKGGKHDKRKNLEDKGWRTVQPEN